MEESNPDDERTYRDARADLIQCDRFHNVVRDRYQNRAYSPEDEELVRKWLAFKDEQARLDQFRADAIHFVIGAGILAACLIPVIQTGLWLYSGEWHSVDLYWLLAEFGVANVVYASLHDPEAWIGVAQIADWWLQVHLSIHALVYAILLAVITWQALNLLEWLKTRRG